MDDSRFMRGSNCGCGLEHKSHRAGGIQRGLLGQGLAGSTTLKQLHDDVNIIIRGLAEVRYGNCIGMLQSPSSLSLTTEPHLSGIVFDKTLTQNFDSHGAIDEQVSGAINSAHAAHAEPRFKPIFVVKSFPN